MTKLFALLLTVFAFNVAVAETTDAPVEVTEEAADDATAPAAN